MVIEHVLLTLLLSPNLKKCPINQTLKFEIFAEHQSADSQSAPDCYELSLGNLHSIVLHTQPSFWANKRNTPNSAAGWQRRVYSSGAGDRLDVHKRESKSQLYHRHHPLLVRQCYNHFSTVCGSPSGSLATQMDLTI